MEKRKLKTKGRRKVSVYLKINLYNKIRQRMERDGFGDYEIGCYVNNLIEGSMKTK